MSPAPYLGLDLGLDRGGDRVEQGAQLGTEQGDGSDDDDGDQRNHEPVLDGGGTTVAAKRSDLDLKLDESRKHVGPLHRTKTISRTDLFRNPLQNAPQANEPPSVDLSSFRNLWSMSRRPFG